MDIHFLLGIHNGVFLADTTSFKNVSRQTQRNPGHFVSMLLYKLEVQILGALELYKHFLGTKLVIAILFVLPLYGGKAEPLIVGNSLLFAFPEDSACL